MAKGIRASLKIDFVTLQGNFGHFTRILIDADLSKELPESLMIEREGHKLCTYLEYQNISAFYKNCPTAGYSLASCKRNAISRKLEANPPTKAQKYTFC